MNIKNLILTIPISLFCAFTHTLFTHPLKSSATALLINVNQRFLATHELKDQIGQKKQEIKSICEALETKKDEQKKLLFFTTVGSVGGACTGLNALETGSDLLNKSLMSTNDVFLFLSYSGSAVSTAVGFALLSGGLLFPYNQWRNIRANRSEIRKLKQELQQKAVMLTELQEKLKKN